MTGQPIPIISAEQMQQAERLLPQSYHIDLVQLMDQAGRSVAELARVLLDQDLLDRSIVVLAGRGNNGGVGLAAARTLLNWGADVQILCSYPPDDYTRSPAQQLRSLQAMGAPLSWAGDGWELPPCDLIVDAIIGYGLRGEPRGPARGLIQLTTASVAPILSVDLPSGLDSESGTVFEPCVRATATAALALPKAAHFNSQGRSLCGDLYLVDAGIPNLLYTELGLDEPPPLFARAAFVRLLAEGDSSDA